MVSAPMAVLKLCGFCLLEAFGFLNKDFGLAVIKLHVKLIFVVKKPYVFVECHIHMDVNTPHPTHDLFLVGCAQSIWNVNMPLVHSIWIST